MSRLWDKGLPLDERVLRYTAGEDHQLDARLVSYDVRGSIAHAEMLQEQELLSAEEELAQFEKSNRNYFSSPQLVREHGRLKRDVDVYSVVWAEIQKQIELVQIKTSNIIMWWPFYTQDTFFFFFF